MVLDPTGVVVYDAPLKAGREEFASGLVIDWPRRWRERPDAGDLETALTALDTDPRFSRYYEHARQFAAYSARNPDWYKRRPGEARPEPDLRGSDVALSTPALSESEPRAIVAGPVASIHVSLR